MKIQIKRSARKTLVAEIKKDGSVIVRAPYFCSSALIELFLKNNAEKIEEKRQKLMQQPEAESISLKKREELRKIAKEIILPRLEYWSQKTGFSYLGVRITSARTRFGSCSYKNNISFSLFLALLSSEEIDYVILHELCHTKEHNHSPAFYSLVSKFMPDYKEREKRLKKFVFPDVRE